MIYPDVIDIIHCPSHWELRKSFNFSSSHYWTCPRIYSRGYTLVCNVNAPLLSTLVNGITIDSVIFTLQLHCCTSPHSPVVMPTELTQRNAISCYKFLHKLHGCLRSECSLRKVNRQIEVEKSEFRSENNDHDQHRFMNERWIHSHSGLTCNPLDIQSCCRETKLRRVNMNE